MSAQTARKVALAYWGFSSKASARAKSGIDIDIIKGNGESDLESSTGPEQRFAAIVEKSWEDYTGQIGGFGRMPFETLVDLATKAKSNNDVVSKSNMDEVEKWVKTLINSNSNYFIAKTTYKNQDMKILINTKR
tara:strand:- start:1216 stop:1617 length:402 start_codon:yes stop_codon:yes gene_type:complete